MLGEGPNFGNNGSFSSPEKKFDVDFCKENTKVFLSLHYNADSSYLFVNRKEIFNFKADNKNANLSTQFCLGSIYNEFSIIEFRGVPLN